MGCDAAGNRYYENRVDYPFGQHRWVEPGMSGCPGNKHCRSVDMYANNFPFSRSLHR
jgi:hypothetical protein